MNPSTAKPRFSVSWRLFYAFAVVWIFSYVLLSPLIRRGPVQYRSTAELQFTLDQDQQLTSDELVALLKSVVRRVADPDALDRLRETITVPIYASDALGSDDIDAIRRRLSISQSSRDRGLRLAVSFRGAGGIDDQEFVNQLANRLAVEVPRHSDHNALAKLVRANAECMDMSKQINLAEQIRAEVAQVNESISEIKEQIAPGTPGSLSAQIEELERQQQILREQHAADSAHPEMIALQQNIERLRTEMLNDPTFRPVQIGGEKSLDAKDAIKNQFYQASAKISPERSAEPSVSLTEQLSKLDLSRIGMAATRLRSHAESVHDLQNDIGSAIVNRIQSTAEPVAKLSSVHYASNPQLLLGSAQPPFWLFAVPCMTAVLVVMYYNPLRDRMQLKTLGDVARSTRLTVLGAMSIEQSAPLSRRSERMAAWTLRSAEYSLLLIGVVVCGACAMRPQVFSAVLANPLIALSNWFWLIVS